MFLFKFNNTICVLHQIIRDATTPNEEIIVKTQ